MVNSILKKKVVRNLTYQIQNILEEEERDEGEKEAREEKRRKCSCNYENVYWGK